MHSTLARSGRVATLWAVELPPAARPVLLADAAGVIDYRLARRAVLDEYRRGRLTTVDVCDAQPELRRAAETCARSLREPCPICEAEQLVEVTYVFGPGLPRSGRCVDSEGELAKVTRRARGTRPYVCYVVEVCRACSWNYLVRAVPVAGEVA